MRYPWKDMYGMEIELGDYVRDTEHMRIGYVELNSRGVPCIHIVEKLTHANGWVKVDNKGPIEAYRIPLFEEHKSKFYWWRHHYILPHITILLKGYK